MEAILQTLKELIAELEPKAKRKAWFDDEDDGTGSNAMDRSGGNFGG